MTDKQAFEIVKTTRGEVSIKDLATGEIMHNPVGPWEESRSLYVRQSRLKQKLLTKSADPLVLFDVGLGGGFNALAALLEFESLAKSRPFHMISFEKNLELFRFSLENINHFPQFLPLKNLMSELLIKGTVTSKPGLCWDIRYGSFTELIHSEKYFPEIVFFDPYSPKVNGEMWTVGVFQAVYDLAKQSSQPSTLMTYSAATGIRTGLLLAGYFVGTGVSSGLKEQTTFASTDFNDILDPFQNRWLERWQRSHTPLPPHCSLTREEALQRLLKHPQWAATTQTRSLASKHN